MKRINGVGISSLLVIFAVLCMTVFAVLSVSTVQAQLRLAESTRRAVTGYYSADCCAEHVLAQLRAGEHPENVEKVGDIYTYACRISETQVLAIRVTVNGTDYKILQWQAVSVAEWNTEDKLPVWDGKTP